LLDSSSRLLEVKGGLENRSEPDQVYAEAVVDERPEVLSGPQLEYPDLLRQASIQGRVVVQAIIDTTGRAEPASVKVIQSPNPGFDQPAKTYLLEALLRPARVHGRAVRVLINLPIDFSIKR
jgi:TonB family protein